MNITLLFGLKRYREIADAFISGLEERCRRGDRVDMRVSIAGFFLSRIEVLVDAEFEKLP